MTEIVDIEYTCYDGMWVRLHPTSEKGRGLWGELHALGDDCIFSAFWPRFLQDMRKAGYRVRKAPKVKQTADELLTALGIV